MWRPVCWSCARLQSGRRVLPVTRPPGRHPEVGVSDAARTVRGEDERLTIPRQRGLRIDAGGVDWRSDVHGPRPRFLNGVSRGAPDIEVAKGPSAVRRHEQLQTVGAYRDFLV